MKYIQLKNKITKLERVTLDALMEKKPNKNNLKDEWLDCYNDVCLYKNTNFLSEEDLLYFKLIQVKKLLSMTR